MILISPSNRKHQPLIVVLFLRGCDSKVVSCMQACIYKYINTYIHTYTYIHTGLLLISMLWHRQAIFESKGFTQRVSGTESLADWMPADKPTELSMIKLKTWTPFDQQDFSSLDPTAVWHSHLALAIYMFALVNFDVLAKASDFRIERRQVVFLCCIQTLRVSGTSRLNVRWQTDWAIEDQAEKLELDSPSLGSASIQPIRPHCRLEFAPASGDKHVCCC